MSFSQTPNLNLFPVAKYWGWTLFWGILLLILGILAIAFDVFTTLLSVIFIGYLLVLGGIIIIIDSFTSWWRKWGSFILHLLIGIIYVIVGLMVIQNPIMASISLTLLIGIFYVVVGLLRIIYTSLNRLPNRGTRIFSGIISLVLGLAILANWPAASLFIIGLFIGIDLIIAGWAYIMMGFMGKRLVHGK